MDINEFKDTVKKITKIYLEKDEKGKFTVDIRLRRPIIVYGSPGVGKTYSIEQIAGELGIGFVNVCMTHHTRQSAVGLPAIKKVEIDGEKKEITEYTLSEILAKVYKYKEEHKKDTGILFIDEFNTLSPSLEPAMLQFLQEKTFGGNKLPEGYIIVAAGNHYADNHSVHELDAATQDRFLSFDLEAEPISFFDYAEKKKFNKSVIDYTKRHFTDISRYEYNDNAQEIVTPRSWEQLSMLLNGYEKNEFEVTEELIRSVIKSDKVAKNFFSEYKIYNGKLTGEEDLCNIILTNGVDALSDHFDKEEMDYDTRWMMAGKLFEGTELYVREKDPKKTTKNVLNSLGFIKKYMEDTERNYFINKVLNSNEMCRLLYKEADPGFIEELKWLFYAA